MENVTRIKELEEKLEASETLLKSMERAASLGRWAIDLAEGIFVCSDQFRRIYGLSTNQVLTLDDWYELVHPEDQAEFREMFGRSLALTHLCETEHRLILDDGTLRYVRQEWRVHHNADMNPVMIKGFCTDQSELHFQLVQESAIWEGCGNGLLIVDPSGSIVRANTAATTMLEAGLTGQQFERVFGVDFASMLETGGQYTGLNIAIEPLEPETGFLVTIDRSSGPVSSISYMDELPFAALEVTEQGRIVFGNKEAFAKGLLQVGMTVLGETVLSSAQDSLLSVIREVRETGDERNGITISSSAGDVFQTWVMPKAEHCLLLLVGASDNGYLQSIEASSDAKSRFLTTISQWMRTPLNAVLGFHQLISKSGQLSGEQRENLEMAKKNGLELLKIINDIQEISRIESAQIEVSHDEIRIDELAKSITDTFTGRSDRIEFEVQTGSDVPRSVYSDYDKIRQILFTLLNNAFKFTRFGQVGLQITMQGSELVFSVSDTGEGIPAQQQISIFEPFQHLRYETDQGYGTSLGLPICSSYAKALDGTLSMSSEVGVGSTFMVRIPVHDVNLTLPLEAADSEQPLLLPRVLVVDDSFPTREILKQLLTSEGVVYEEAGNGYEALEKARTFQPEVILMDLEMPVMDGFEATRLIKQEMNVKILAISAKVFAADVRRAYQAGIDGFIEKPYRLTTIMNEISAAVEGHQNRNRQFDDVELGDVVSQLTSFERLQLQTAILGSDQHRFRSCLHSCEGLDEESRDMLEEMVDTYQYEKVIKVLTLPGHT